MAMKQSEFDIFVGRLLDLNAQQRATLLEVLSVQAALATVYELFDGKQAGSEFGGIANASTARGPPVRTARRAIAERTNGAASTD